MLGHMNQNCMVSTVHMLVNINQNRILMLYDVIQYIRIFICWSILTTFVTHLDGYIVNHEWPEQNLCFCWPGPWILIMAVWMRFSATAHMINPIIVHYMTWCNINHSFTQWSLFWVDLNPQIFWSKSGKLWIFRWSRACELWGSCHLCR